MDENYLLTLPSDFTSDVFKNNKISNYKIDFKNPFKLTEDYECGLVEMIFPTSVRNIPKDVNIYLKYKDFQSNNLIIV